jgi:hypothetical protein
MKFPSWAPEDSRWRHLAVYDKILDGKLYDHLAHDFYQEEVAGRYIPLLERRPAAQYRVCRYVARWAARKLFAGRHVPKVRGASVEVENEISDMLTGTKIWPTMLEAAFRGSVGSVAVTFRIENDKVGLKVWRALWCSPTFDDFGELTNLRIHYTTDAAALAAIGIFGAEPNRPYWFIRDYGLTSEITYKPVRVEDWNPVQGFLDPNGTLEIIPEMVVPHNLGFVPGVWIMNPFGCDYPDGAPLWYDSIPDMIEIDYLMSQAARGTRYNCSPQLVTVGPVRNSNAETGTNPTTMLAFEPAHRDGESGEMIGAGDAKLLEMAGTGAEAAIKLVEVLKRHALEQTGVVQKDPKDMPGPLSGRAMEYLDEDAHDTAMQWRTTYGEGGALLLICKIARVLRPKLDVTKLWLQWPRIYQPTPADLQSMVQALVMACTPIQVPGAKPNEEDGSVPSLQPLLDPAWARAYLLANLDAGILDDTAGDSPVGPSGGEPAEVSPEEILRQQGPFGPFWRILPPTRVPS